MTDARAAPAAGDAAAPGAGSVRPTPAPSTSCPLLELVVADQGQPSGNRPNRCTAFVPARPLGETQQRLVCLELTHLDCPLYVRSRHGRGTARSQKAERPEALEVAAIAAAGSRWAGPRRPRLGSLRRGQAHPAPGSAPTIIAGLVLVAALAIAVGFMAARGGLDFRSASAGPSGLAGASAAAAGSSPNPAPTLPTPSPTPAESPVPSPSSEPSLTPSLAPAPSASVAASPPPAYAGLEPCPNTANCYLYHVQSGDTLTGISRHFAITLEALRTANLDISDPSLIHVGDVIHVPLPVR